MTLKRRRPLVPRPPWGSFLAGGLAAALWTVPLLTLVAHAMRPRPVDAESFRTVAKLTLALTTLPAFLCGGGVARGASDSLHFGRRWLQVVGFAGCQMALAGVALGTIALAPYGLPESPVGWLGGAALGALAAAPSGAGIAAFTLWRIRRGGDPAPAPREGARAKS